MKIVALDQGTIEWLEWRVQGIGASEIPVIMGRSPWKTPLQLYEEKTGATLPYASTPAMDRGTHFEPEARAWVNHKLNMDFEPLCAEHDFSPYAKASLDGWHEETKTLLEIKVPGEAVLMQAKEGKIPAYYMMQVQWQFFVTGAERGYYCAYDPDDQKGYIIPVEADYELIADMMREAKNFWIMLNEGTAPPPTEKDYVEIDDRDLRPVCEAYISLSGSIANDKKTLKALKEEIISYGDDGNFKAFGLTCTRTQPRAGYDMARMKEDGIDIEKYKKKDNSIGFYTIRLQKR